MPLNWLTDNLKPNEIKSALYVVGTPIGHMEDITLRALRILQQVDCIAAEDTRKTNRLLAFYDIKTRLISCHAFNEMQRIQPLINRLLNGQSIAVVSNAGTPTVSDPGFRLINAAIIHEIDVVPVPGVSAPITALSVGGLPTDAFIFVGFPPRKKGGRKKLLSGLISELKTMIFFESPQRLLHFMEEMLKIMGDRQIVLCREMTKMHEEYLRGKLSAVMRNLGEREKIKGECTLLVEGCGKRIVPDMLCLEKALEKRIPNADTGISALVKEMAQQFGLPKTRVYEAALKIKTARRHKSETGTGKGPF
jgi:16S rRNA (cytidine1402-2'-O)-methyltransferase